MRDTLTQDALALDRAAAEAVGDERGVARARAQMRVLATLPDGFRVERTRADVAPPRDPGLELTLIDERFRPERLVAKVARRRIGRQKITWTGKQLAEPVTADAMGVMLRFATSDAERD